MFRIPGTLVANSSRDCIYLFTYISSCALPRIETLHIVPISRFGQVIFVRKECAVLEAVLIQGLGEQCFPAMAGNVSVFTASEKNGARTYLVPAQTWVL